MSAKNDIGNQNNETFDVRAHTHKNTIGFDESNALSWSAYLDMNLSTTVAIYREQCDDNKKC